MTATPETSHETRDVVGPALQSASPAAVVITEQEVLLGTAASVPAESTTKRWWTEVPRVVAATLRRMVLVSHSDSAQAWRYVPERYDYIERALMSREMDRL